MPTQSLGSLLKENNQLKRDGLKLFAVIEKLQGELEIIQESKDSCSSIVLEYQVLIARMKQIQKQYGALVDGKNAIIDLSNQEIAILKSQSRRLRVKAILTGVLAPVGAFAAGIGVTYLILSVK